VRVVVDGQPKISWVVVGGTTTCAKASILPMHRFADTRQELFLESRTRAACVASFSRWRVIEYQSRMGTEWISPSRAQR
jgi:hypothetical protein